MNTAAVVLAGAGGLNGMVEFARWLWTVRFVRILTAVAVVGAGVVFSKFLVRFLGRPVARRFGRQSVTQTVLGAIRVSAIVVSAFVAGSLVGLGIGDIVLSVTVFSAVLGIVLAPIVGSVINGLFVLADNPYEIGDMIELENGPRGFVDDITLRYTKLLTLDNTFLVIPNSSMRERDVTNYSAEDERTRLSLPLLVTYDGDLEEARRIMERAARSCEAVVGGGPEIRIGSERYPARPTCQIEAYADSGVSLNLRFWVHKPYRIPTVESTVREEIWTRLADTDVEVAYPHRQLVFGEGADRPWVTGGGRDGTRTPTTSEPAGTRGNAESTPRSGVDESPE
jgi:small-conductance mechanosensitive channel